VDCGISVMPALAQAVTNYCASDERTAISKHLSKDGGTCALTRISTWHSAATMSPSTTRASAFTGTQWHLDREVSLRGYGGALVTPGTGTDGRALQGDFGTGALKRAGTATLTLRPNTAISGANSCGRMGFWSVNGPNRPIFGPVTS